MTSLRQDAEYIVRGAIAAVMPDKAVTAALVGKVFPGRVILVAAGKAAWQMANAAWQVLGERIEKGIVITKYNHGKGAIGNLLIREAGHPTPDENGYAATAEALEMVADLNRNDTVLFLLSGGGSALFELPLIPLDELQDVTRQLLACGADIESINILRKRFSRVKGGKFAKYCEPAQVYNVILSDVLGDRVDVIASGPACADTSTAADAVAVVEKYGLQLSDRAWELVKQETPKQINNTTTIVNGSVKQLCAAAAKCCQDLGYETCILTEELTCEAKVAGRMLAERLAENKASQKSVAFVAGGETVVKLTGHGLGGRNQELALSAALGIRGISGAAVFSVGSDGTDGPTDAAGGFVDADTADILNRKGIWIEKILADNDSYYALQAVDGLIMTGPTGTNVNDVAVALLRC